MTAKTSVVRYISVLLLAVIFGVLSSNALPTSIYSKRSVLADGRWVKISVAESGIHFISKETLRSWGFTDPSKVRVHGYGGNRQPSVLSVANYKDDLPEVACERTQKGIYFYGEGPVEWSYAYQNITQTLNPYTTNGYYFLTQGDAEPARVNTVAKGTSSAAPVDYFEDCVFHEQDLVSISKSGTALYGEDMRHTRSHTFRFNLYDKIDSVLVNGEKEPVQSRFRASAVFNAVSNASFDYYINGEKIGYMSGKPTDAAYATRVTTNKLLYLPETEVIDVRIDFVPTGTVSEAYLDAVAIQYNRALRLHEGYLEFRVGSTAVKLANVKAGQTRVWDITNPVRPMAMSTSTDGDVMTWVNPYTGNRNYVAWTESAKYPTPVKVSEVANQNLHGIEELPDMVIFTVRDWAGEAERIAALHRAAPDNMNVLVVDQDLVFNEFSSGSRDPEGFRRMLKMLYDRGKEAGKAPKYVLLMGRPTYDNRCLTQEMKTYNVPFIPTWQSAESLSKGSSIMSDDYIVMLEDNSGSNMMNDVVSMAGGRISCRSLKQAKDYVDKLYRYVSNEYKTEWKSTVVIESDNANDGCFMESSEEFYRNMFESEDASIFNYTKVFIDAFPQQNGVAVGARDRFYRTLDEGMMFWLYQGHGALVTLGDEKLHTRADIEKMDNDRWPFLFASTCDFGRWDGVDLCGLEIFAFNPNGGIIAGTSSPRKAYIGDNNKLVAELGNHMLRRGEDGNFLRVGEMLKNAKNGMIGKGGNSTTKNTYILFGDPAMRLNIPRLVVSLDSISDEEVTPEAQVTIKARQRVTLKGSVRNIDGTEMSDFNGSVSVTLYDAEQSTTTLGTYEPINAPGKVITFDEKGGRLFTGRAKVVNGRFAIDVAMPFEVADNFRPATLNMFAWSDAGEEAIGINRDFYVYGFDDTAEPDDQAPTIDYAYLNHSSFVDGSVVGEQPVFLAGVSDNVGINLSSAGIGHQMSLKLDDRTAYSDLSLYYTPSSDGSASGTISYPLSNLEEGNHTLSFRVWDTSGNSTTRTIEFFVEHGVAPKLLDIYTDVNPAIDHANFYINHDRPDATATVNLSIYNMAGRMVWSSSQTGRSDMFTSAPIQWNLTDLAGRRVPHGIYIYRATLVIDGTEMVSPAKKIAVVGR